MIKKQHYNDVMGTLLNIYIYKVQEPKGEINSHSSQMFCNSSLGYEEYLHNTQCSRIKIPEMILKWEISPNYIELTLKEKQGGRNPPRGKSPLISREKDLSKGKEIFLFEGTWPFNPLLHAH